MQHIIGIYDCLRNWLNMWNQNGLLFNDIQEMQKNQNSQFCYLKHPYSVLNVYIVIVHCMLDEGVQFGFCNRGRSRGRGGARPLPFQEMIVFQELWMECSNCP